MAKSLFNKKSPRRKSISISVGEFYNMTFNNWQHLAYATMKMTEVPNRKSSAGAFSLLID